MEILNTINIVDSMGVEKSIKVSSEMSSYRKFSIEKNAVVTGAFFNLEKSNNISDTRKRINKILTERNSKHPVDLPSAGSVFKNPEGHSSWKLVNDAGLKGKKIGGAMVSDLHTNFIVNDVVDLAARGTARHDVFYSRDCRARNTAPGTGYWANSL